MRPDPQDMKVNLYVRPYVHGRLEKVKYQALANHKNMLLLNDVAKNVGYINGSKLGREQFKASSDLDRNSSEAKKSIVRHKMLRKCLKMRRVDSSSLRNPNMRSVNYGHYGGIALKNVARDIDLFMSPEFKRLEKMQKAQEKMQSSQEKGFILQNEQIFNKCHDYLEKKWGVKFPKPKVKEENDKWKNIAHEKIDSEHLPPIFKFYKPYYAKPKPLKPMKFYRRKTTRSVMITDLSDTHSHISGGDRSHISGEEKSHDHRAEITALSASTRRSNGSIDEESVVYPRNVGGTRRLSNVGLLDEPPIDAIRRMSMMSMNSEVSQNYLTVPEPDSNYLGIKESDFARLESTVREDSVTEDSEGENSEDSAGENVQTTNKKFFLPKIVVGKPRT